MRANVMRVANRRGYAYRILFGNASSNMQEYSYDKLN
jgi:hypothetical protein